MSVEREIATGNHWYVDDQAVAQLGTPGARMVIENRWRMFERAIRTWIDGQGGRVAPLRLLDAGCGDGNNLAALRTIVAKLERAATIVGVDYNTLRLARARDRAQVPALKADLSRLPFPAGGFDIILCNHVIEHIPDDVAVLRELARVLAPSGLLLVGVPNEGCFIAQVRNHVFQRGILRTTDHVHFHTAESLLRRLATAGLVPLGPVQRESFYLPHLRANLILRETRFGRSLLEWLASWMPSQSAGLLVAATPAPDRR
jgi:SAM-dependent methyltransferase